MIGKRINVGGALATVIEDDGFICTIKYDKYITTGGVLTDIVRQMPEVISRDSFDYRPGDRHESS